MTHGRDQKTEEILRVLQSDEAAEIAADAWFRAALDIERPEKLDRRHREQAAEIQRRVMREVCRRLLRAT